MQGTGLGRLVLSLAKSATDGSASCNNLGLCSGFFESGSSRGGRVGGGTCLAWGAEIEVQKSPPQPRPRPAPTPPPGRFISWVRGPAKKASIPPTQAVVSLHSVSWPSPSPRSPTRPPPRPSPVRPGPQSWSAGLGHRAAPGC